MDLQVLSFLLETLDGTITSKVGFSWSASLVKGLIGMGSNKERVITYSLSFKFNVQRMTLYCIFKGKHTLGHRFSSVFFDLRYPFLFFKESVLPTRPTNEKVN